MAGEPRWRATGCECDKTPSRQAGAGSCFEAGQVDYRWEVDICVYKHTGPSLLIVVNQATSLALGLPVAVATAVWKPYILQHLPRS